MVERETSAETLLSKPPVAIFIQDDWRGTGHKNIQKAWDTMLSRCAVAAYLYHSNLYSDANRPLIASFAAEHQPNQEPGSTRIAYFLADSFKVAEKDIFARKHSANLSGDLTAVHAFINRMRGNGRSGPLAIVTSDDLAGLVSLEWQNHFQDHQYPHPQPTTWIISPSTRIFEKVTLPNTLPRGLKEIISNCATLGLSKYTHSGSEARILWVTSHLPGPIRRALITQVRKVTKPYIPHYQKRVTRAGRVMYEAQERGRFIKAEEEYAYQSAYKYPRRRS